MKEKIYTTYAPDTDITFIMKETEVNRTTKTVEVIGFYYGEPDGVNTKQYINNLKATFENELEIEITTSI